MFLICRGEVEVVESSGQIKGTLKEGDIFGEVGVLKSTPRNATVRAKRMVDLFVLEKCSFQRILSEHPQFAERISTIAQSRYDVSVTSSELIEGDAR
jgi:CRP-like cAMP-binding protein